MSSLVQNNAGGTSYRIDIWQRLERFLILGAEGGTYYQSAASLLSQNLASLVACLDADGPRTLATIATISQDGRALKQTPAIVALAHALQHPDLATRRMAAEHVVAICRTASHLFELAEALKARGGGWGRLRKRALASWYRARSTEALVYQVIKYRQRHGWSHRDLLRILHLVPRTEAEQALFAWITQSKMPDPRLVELRQLQAFERLQSCTRPADAAALIRDHGLTWECVPPELLGQAQVWGALLERMPLGAMLRNLARMTANGLMRDDRALERVLDKLSNGEALRRARLHPLQILNALGVYRNGRGRRGKLEWRAVPAICQALDAAFYASFDHLDVGQSRTVLALDISGSMSCGSCAGLTGLTPREASAAMAMAIARSEERYRIVGFSHKLIELPISRSMDLGTVLDTISGLPFGSTDCALPMRWAREQELDVDHFVVLTDNETWYGPERPDVALRRYRQARMPQATLAVCAMTSASFSIADPDDPGMLDICGADANLPRLLREWTI